MEIRVLLGCLCLVSVNKLVLSQRICPSKVVEFDDYDVRDRFNALMKDIGDTPLKVQYEHQRSGGKKEKYDYTVQFCGTNGDNAITQVSTTNSDDVHIVGKFDNASILIGAEDWIFLHYQHGDPYDGEHHCNGKQRQAFISIRCEEDGEKPTLRVIEEARYNSLDRHEDTICYYLFEYNHETVCTNVKKHKLSGGAIFCIILFSLAAAYLLLGFLYQRFVAGAKGFEQIPNYSFWKKVGNASADGCDLVCRREDHPNTYKGMADALDIDSSDDDDVKDDGLLPM